ATSDLQEASRIARSMVKEFGMSRLGRIHYGEQNGPAFLPRGPWGEEDRGYSEQTAREIDLEVGKILQDATEEGRRVILERRSALEAVAQRLMEKEVIDGAELRLLLEEHDPGPKLVPGSLAVDKGVPPVEAEEPAAEDRALRMEDGF